MILPLPAVTRARDEYEHGWPVVLDRFREVAETPETADTWVALMHRPGPNAPGGAALFADPRFADHLAFLKQLQAAGYLVAAGPLSDEPGAGMAVLRLPGADRVADAVRLATVEDKSVANGFFDVTVRPWRVVLH